MQIVQDWIHAYGYGGLFGLLFFEMLGVPIPVEAALAFAGMEWTAGTFRLLPLLLVAYAANIGGGTAAYGIGRFAGRQALLALFRRIGHADKFELVEARFRAYSMPLLLFSRFFIGVRVFVPYLAGINRLSFAKFSFYNFLSGLVWVTAYIFFGRTLHRLWNRYHKLWNDHSHAIALIGAAAAVVLIVAAAVWLRRRRRGKRAASAAAPSSPESMS